MVNPTKESTKSRRLTVGVNCRISRGDYKVGILRFFWLIKLKKIPKSS